MGYYNSIEEGFQRFRQDLKRPYYQCSAFDSDFLASLQGDLRQQAEALLLEALDLRDDSRALFPLAAMSSSAGYALMERVLERRDPRFARDPAIVLWRHKRLPAAWNALAWLLRHEVGSVDSDIILSEVLRPEKSWRSLRWAYWILAKSEDTDRARAGLYILFHYHVLAENWAGNKLKDPQFGHIFRQLVDLKLDKASQQRCVRELIGYARAHKGERIEALPEPIPGASTPQQSVDQEQPIQTSTDTGLLGRVLRIFRK